MTTRRGKYTGVLPPPGWRRGATQTQCWAIREPFGRCRRRSRDGKLTCERHADLEGAAQRLAGVAAEMRTAKATRETARGSKL